MLERDLEDAICRDPEGILGEGYSILYRQLRLDHGRLDLLAWHNHTYDGRVYHRTIEPIELKKGEIKAQDVAQLLRYIHDMENALACNDDAPCYEECDTLTVDREVENRLSDLIFSADSPLAFVRGMLIGASIGTNALCAAHGAGIAVCLWSIADGKIRLDRPAFLDCSVNQDWALDVIAIARQAIRQDVTNEATEQADEGRE